MNASPDNSVPVVLIYKEEYPWDVRVEKVARTLARELGPVTIVARNVDARPRRESDGELAIARIPTPAFLPNLIRRLINARVVMNPFWVGTAFSAAFGKRGGIVIVRDLPLIWLGWIVARLCGMSLVFDMAECYPEMYRSIRELGSGGPVRRWLRSPSLAEWYEKIACRVSDLILVMIEESGERLLRKGVRADKVIMVSNTPLLPASSQAEVAHAGTALRIIYVGFVTRLRGLDQLLHAVKGVIDRSISDTDIRVDIVGVGPATSEIQALSEALGLQEVVRLHGWLEKPEVERLMKASNVGALTYRVCSHWNHTIPNKIFDYMLEGKPVLATRVLPIMRILDDARAGFACIDVPDMTRRLIELRDPEVRAALGGNGRRVVVERFNWNTDAKRLLQALGCKSVS